MGKTQQNTFTLTNKQNNNKEKHNKRNTVELTYIELSLFEKSHSLKSPAKLVQFPL
jgi:hypothetical protein